MKTDDFETVAIGTVKKLEQIEKCSALQAKFMLDLNGLMEQLAEDLGEILDE